MDPLRLKFHPTYSEGLEFLLRFMAKEEMDDSGFITTNLDVYGEEEPWEIYSQGVPSGGPEDDDSHNYRYFITKKNKGENNGTWKQQGQEKPVLPNVRNSPSPVLGFKKKMHHVHKFGHWIMKEYDLSPLFTGWLDEDRTDYVMCAIKKEYINDCSFHDTSTTTTS